MQKLQLYICVLSKLCMKHYWFHFSGHGVYNSVCVYVCSLIAPDLVGRLSPYFQGSLMCPRDGFRCKRDVGRREALRLLGPS